MRYGLNVSNPKTLFPLSIDSVTRTPEGHVELVIRHSYGRGIGDTLAGRVTLGPQEAAALADELVAPNDPTTLRPMTNVDGSNVTSPDARR